MVAELTLCAVVVATAAAELLHARRVRRVAPLAFGPLGRPRNWARAAPLLRVAACGALAWGLITLMQLPPKIHSAAIVAEDDLKHLVIALDVSPSMRLADAGPDQTESRRRRAFAVMESFFARVPMPRYRVSVIAFYNGAKPVVVDTRDLEVVRNILDDLPLQYAFEAGKTDLFSSLAEVAKITEPWRPRSTTVILLTDGDTVPATGMPKMPAAVGDVVVVGLGDAKTGSFIDGQQSRQDSSTLRQVAIRLGGTYHDGNQRHLGTNLIERISGGSDGSGLPQLTRREFALLAISIASLVLALLPLLLHFAGTHWAPGVRSSHAGATGREGDPRSLRRLAARTIQSPGEKAVS